MDVLELDSSKYDKSQNEFHCAVEYEIWRRLGLEDFLAEVWKQGHKLSGYVIAVTGDTHIGSSTALSLLQ